MTAGDDPLPADLIAAALARFGVAGELGVTFVRHGENTTYRIAGGDGRRYALRVHVGSHRELDPLPEPRDGQLVLSDLVVGQTGGVVEPHVVRLGGFQLGPDRGRLFLAPGAKVKLRDV